MDSPFAHAPTDGTEMAALTANRRRPLLSGLLASGPFLKDELLKLVEPHLPMHELNS